MFYKTIGECFNARVSVGNFLRLSKHHFITTSLKKYGVSKTKDYNFLTTTSGAQKQRIVLVFINFKFWENFIVKIEDVP